ncbi:MAG TPA: LuxR C-terminal-related transcriptional regulator, partial [Steroidobacteraceae bacterium]|nr:LuxR C-terminal-related transcriptional regulator [Steroidobacteraceae bacterium]
MGDRRKGERRQGDRRQASAAAKREAKPSFTRREREIVDLLMQGMTNRQIAQDMYLAEKTVKNYVSSMLAKLGLTSRTQAAIFSV